MPGNEPYVDPSDRLRSLEKRVKELQGEVEYERREKKRWMGMYLDAQSEKRTYDPVSRSWSEGHFGDKA